MQECKQQMPLCQCIDWKCGDMSIGVSHLINNFEFQRFALEYSALEPEEHRRLCKVGRCRVCGKRLCIGEELPAHGTADDLLESVYYRVFNLWDSINDRLPDGVNCFRDMFLSLFHEPDQDFVKEWLNDPNRCHSREEGK